MAYLVTRGSPRIEDASADDLRAIFQSQSMVGVELGDTKAQTQINALIIGDSTSQLIFADQKHQRSYKPSGLSRDQAQQVLEYFLAHGTRDPGIEWKEIDLPWVPAQKRGCFGAAAVLLTVIVLIWRCL